MKDYKIKKAILKRLYSNRNEYLSGEDISEVLGFSRANAWKYIKKLIAEGFIIEAVPKKGYKLISCPDKLYGHDISATLSTKFIGIKNICYYDKVESTNDKAYKLAEVGVDEGSIVIAETQTKGKGRMGRSWESPHGTGLYFSIILRPKVALTQLPSITLVASGAIVKVLRNIYNVDAGIKWPNDIFLGDGKLGGILTEIKAQQDMVEFVIIGIGLNVNTPEKDLPSCGTSLLACKDKLFNRKEVLKNILETFEVDYNDFIKAGFAVKLSEIKDLSIVLGEVVSVEIYDKVIKGKVLDIDETGALIIQTQDNKLTKVFSGDVTLCRRK